MPIYGSPVGDTRTIFYYSPKSTVRAARGKNGTTENLLPAIGTCRRTNTLEIIQTTEKRSMLLSCDLIVVGPFDFHCLPDEFLAADGRQYSPAAYYTSAAPPCRGGTISLFIFFFFPLTAAVPRTTAAAVCRRCGSGPRRRRQNSNGAHCAVERNNTIRRHPAV